MTFEVDRSCGTRTVHQSVESDDPDHPRPGDPLEPRVSIVRCSRCPALHVSPGPDPVEAYWTAVDDGWRADGPARGRLRCAAHVGVRPAPYWADFACPDCGQTIGRRVAIRVWLTVTDATLVALASVLERAVDEGDPADSRLYRLRAGRPWKTLTRPVLAATTYALNWRWTVAWTLEEAADRRADETAATTGVDGWNQS